MEKGRKELILKVIPTTNANIISLNNLYLKCHKPLPAGLSKLKRFHGIWWNTISRIKTCLLLSSPETLQLPVNVGDITGSKKALSHFEKFFLFCVLSNKFLKHHTSPVLFILLLLFCFYPLFVFCILIDVVLVKKIWGEEWQFDIKSVLRHFSMWQWRMFNTNQVPLIPSKENYDCLLYRYE